jgi:hypothetical protein
MECDFRTHKLLFSGHLFASYSAHEAIEVRAISGVSVVTSAIVSFSVVVDIAEEESLTVSSTASPDWQRLIVPHDNPYATVVEGAYSISDFSHGQSPPFWTQPTESPRSDFFFS